MAIPLVLAGAAASIGVDGLRDAAGEALKLIDPARSWASPSLTHSLRKTMITSRIYIDGTIGMDPVVPDIIRSSHTLYTSLILNALQIDQLVSNGNTVGELLNTISTEHLQAPHLDTAELFQKFCGTEANYGSPSAGYKPPHGGQPTPSVTPEAQKYFGSALVKQDDTGHLPYGRMIEVEFRAPSAKKDDPSVKVNVLVQMLPYMIHPSIATEFVKLNATPGFFKRLNMWRAGELAFWRDFVFSMDIYSNRRRIARNDVDGVLNDYLNEQVRKDANTLMNLVGALLGKDPEKALKAGPDKRNVANSVLIFSEETVQRTKAEVGFDLHDAGDRGKYFRETYSMLIYVVDPMYNTVKLYMNGIRGVGTYTFDAFKAKGKNNEVVNLMAAIAAMTQGQAPRF